jgi:hypothetical protein
MGNSQQVQGDPKKTPPREAAAAMQETGKVLDFAGDAWAE